MEDRTSPGERGQVDAVSRLIGMDIDEYLAEDLAVAEARNEWRKDAEAIRGLKAMALAPTLIICRALLRGERVPWNLLSYFQAERYGLRRRPTDHRLGLDDFNDVQA